MPPAERRRHRHNHGHCCPACHQRALAQSSRGVCGNAGSGQRGQDDQILPRRWYLPGKEQETGGRGHACGEGHRQPGSRCAQTPQWHDGREGDTDAGHDADPVRAWRVSSVEAGESAKRRYRAPARAPRDDTSEQRDSHTHSRPEPEVPPGSERRADQAEAHHTQPRVIRFLASQEAHLRLDLRQPGTATRSEQSADSGSRVGPGRAGDWGHEPDTVSAQFLMCATARSASGVVVPNPKNSR